MGIENRPYIGSWKLDDKLLVQYTPDALVYINGDLTLPGCTTCSGGVDIQQYLTEVSVDASTDPGGASASFTLSIPLHHASSVGRDSKHLMKPGLEVHVYLRGYFPVKDLFSAMAEGTREDPSAPPETPPPTPGVPPPDAPQAEFENVLEMEFDPEVLEDFLGQGGPATTALPKRNSGVDFSKVPPALLEKWDGKRGFRPLSTMQGSVRANAVRAYAAAEVIEQYWRQQFPDAEVHIGSHVRSNSHNHASGSGFDLYVTHSGGTEVVGAVQTWGALRKLMDPNAARRLPAGGSGLYLQTGNQVNAATGIGADQQGRARDMGAGHDPLPPGGNSWVHFDDGGDRIWVRVGTGSAAHSSQFASDDSNKGDPHRHLRSEGLDDIADYAQKNGTWKTDPDLPEVGPNVQNVNQVLGQEEGSVPEATPLETAATGPGEIIDLIGAELEPVPEPDRTLKGPSLLDDLGLGDSGLEDVLIHPYYHCFHGVVKQVDFAYSGGVNTVTVTCASMLHFWGYHNISTNASVFGARPTNSKLKTSMVGHNFTGMHPYEIIYTLHNDMAGSAGGVGFAMSSASNQKAKDALTGESLFGLAIEYWKRRFDQGMIKLRLHAASGELFSTTQAAFLGRMSSNVLLKLVRDRFPHSGGKASHNNILSSSFSQALFNRQRAGGLIQAQKSRPTSQGGASLEINLVEMQAFVLGLSAMGQVNLFESTYETKLDIANKVCEVTGFEFFQDVDGDFVFKPPMYNLDTSESRVYRIEDIDIMSISFSVKEPEVTYMTVKGSQFKNLHDTGLDNEWGVKGQYIDYRLVAQYGWRAGSFETAYLNDAKAMFYAAVNRMDVLNSGMTTASVTIPERPELRPGYPVYIPYLDSYFYLTGFAHGHTVGGFCSTSLQLTARRAPFDAPGNPNLRGIESIDLGNPFLPARPLEVATSQGAALPGFPNVVMALDPTRLNPLFLIVGSDIENLSDPGSLRNLFQMAHDLGIVQKQFVDPANPEAVRYVISMPDVNDPSQRREVTFSLDDTEFQGEGQVERGRRAARRAAGRNRPQAGVVDALAAARAHSGRQAAQGALLEGVQKRAAKLQSQIDAKFGQIRQLDPDKDKDLARIVKLREEIYGIGSESPIPPESVGGTTGRARGAKSAAIRGGLQGQKDALVQEMADAQANFAQESLQDDPEGVGLLLGLVREVGQQYRKIHPEFGNLDSTINLLDMLSDKKATFSNGSQPGAYRYYSASHPDPEQQGQPLWEYVSPPPGSEERAGIRTTAPALEGDYVGRKVFGFLPSDQVQALEPGGKIPEAAMGMVEVRHGIRVLTNNPDPALRRGEILPTDQIQELMFSIQRANVSRTRNSTFRTNKANALGAEGLKALTTKFFSLKGQGLGSVKGNGTVTLEDIYLETWDELGGMIKDASEAAHDTIRVMRSGAGVEGFPVFTPPQFLLTLKLRKDTLKTTDALADYIAGGALFGDMQSAGAGAFNEDILADQAGHVLAQSFFNQLARARQAWILSLQGLGLTKPELAAAQGAFHSGISLALGVSVAAKGEKVQGVAAPLKFDIQSPVFPVSDARGYEVIGSYRYGRGVTIDPSGTLDSLQKQDPFSLVDRQTVEEIIAFMTAQKSITTRLPSDAGGGQLSATEFEVSDPQKLQDLNVKILEQLRANMTDQQILDVGLASRNRANPNMLDFSFMNWFAAMDKEGIHKLPVINAAYSLSDLTRHTEENVCDCKAAEASFMLTELGRADYLDIGLAGDYLPEDFTLGDADPVTQMAQVQIARKAPDWAQSQDALRGAVLERKGPGLLSTFGETVKAFGPDGAVQREQEKAIRAFRDAQDQAGGEEG